FTVGIRTSGRSESEQRVLKVFTGPKKSLFQVFNGLNERTAGQSAQSLARILFASILALLRDHACPYALQTCYHEMQESLFYTTTTLQRPNGMRNWNMFNDFTNDKAYVSTKWIIRLVINQGLQIRHIFRVKRLAGVATHYVIVLQDGRVICDCCMGLNLGIPCRHYFQLYTKVEGLTFSIGII
ncbi:hypothetical protein BT96DRAFT_785229, partial [Gymnopus androsaceus JB14]